MEEEDWKVENNFLTREFKFNNFVEAVNFVNKITSIAEEMNHHPDISIHSYNKVKIMLFTHTENKITSKDYTLAKKIDEIN